MTRYHYIDVPERNRIITLAYKPGPNGFDTMHVGWSICQLQAGDQHRKKEGRRLAEERLNGAGCITVPIRKDSTTWYGRMADIYRALSSTEVPSQLYKCMKHTWHIQMDFNTMHYRKVLNIHEEEANNAG